MSITELLSRYPRRWDDACRAALADLLEKQFRDPGSLHAAVRVGDASAELAVSETIARVDRAFQRKAFRGVLLEQFWAFVWAVHNRVIADLGREKKLDKEHAEALRRAPPTRAAPTAPDAAAAFAEHHASLTLAFEAWVRNGDGRERLGRHLLNRSLTSTELPSVDGVDDKTVWNQARELYYSFAAIAKKHHTTSVVDKLFKPWTRRRQDPVRLKLLVGWLLLVPASQSVRILPYGEPWHTRARVFIADAQTPLGVAISNRTPRGLGLLTRTQPEDFLLGSRVRIEFTNPITHTLTGIITRIGLVNGADGTTGPGFGVRLDEQLPQELLHAD